MGVLGIHRFYVCIIGTGILQLITLGGFGIWALIDIKTVKALADYSEAPHRLTVGK
jgi:TM2 domain-containing membrane protein YozV